MVVVEAWLFVWYGGGCVWCECVVGVVGVCGVGGGGVCMWVGYVCVCLCVYVCVCMCRCVCVCMCGLLGGA